MKKLICLITAFIATIFCLCGCGETPLNFDGAYWNGTKPIGFSAIDETCFYDVSVTSSTLSDATEIKNKNLSMTISNGEYKVNLKNSKYENMDCYCLTTFLLIEGKYIFGDNTVEFTGDNADKTETTTYFKTIGENLAPIYSERIVYSNHTAFSNNSNVKVVKFGYKYSISYTDNKATVEISNILDEEKILNIKEGKTVYDNYGKAAYVDNELLTFVPRAFNITDSFLKNFKTIDAVSKTNRNMQFTVIAKNASSSNADKKTIEIPSFSYNFSNSERHSFDTVKLLIKLSDTFDGSPIECYYANTTEEKHRLISAYTRLNSDMGYLKYSINSVTAIY